MIYRTQNLRNQPPTDYKVRMLLYSHQIQRSVIELKNLIINKEDVESRTKLQNNRSSME
jgi:hypothetical protein